MKNSPVWHSQTGLNAFLGELLVLDGVTGQLLIVESNAGVVALTEAVEVQALQDLLNLDRQGQGRAHRVTGLDGVVQILDVEVDLEAGLEVSNGSSKSGLMRN